MPGMVGGGFCGPVAGAIWFQTPVVTMTSPVQVTTMIVSMKVCVIDTSPWRTGCVVWAEAAAIAAEPKPIHVPRERPPAVQIDQGPLILVETRRDLRNMELPFEASQPKG